MQREVREFSEQTRARSQAFAMQIETERLLIRSPQLEDASPLAAIWCDPDVTRYMGGPRDAAEVRELVEKDAQASTPAKYDLWPVVEKSSGRVIGDCGFLEKDVDDQAEIELVYVLASDSWGNGYATEAASSLRDYGFQQLGLPRIISLIDPENHASARVAEKLGMEFEKETLRPGGKIMHVYSIQPEPQSEEA